VTPSRPRWIAHVDIDAFFASVEQRRDPSLRGRPVAVGNGVVASCSYEARALGCRTAMTLAEARRVCPELVILDGHYPTYRCFAERVFATCRRFSPQLETYLDEAVLDLTGTERLWGRPEAVGEEVRRRVRLETGLAVTVGLGSSRMTARLATARAKPDGLGVVPPGREAEYVANLPVEDLPGVGRRTAARLESLNVTTAGGLRRLTREQLVALFGVRGDALFERCRGRDSRVVAAREIPSSISRETSFHRNTADPEEQRAMLYYLVERASAAARELGLAARTVAVKIRAEDGRGDEARRTLREASAVDRRLFAAAHDLLRCLATRRVALHLVGVALSNFVVHGAEQLDLVEAGGADRRGLCDGLDEIRRRFGYGAVVAGPSIALLGNLQQNAHGFVLRTPSLTR
jgi:DNA polymerase-4